MPTDEDLRSRLQALGRHRAIFEAPGFSFGEWQPSWTDDAGVLHLGWYRFSADAEAFLRHASAWVQPFDWMTWSASPEARVLLEDPAAVADATPDQLSRLLTTYVRGERFGDGTLAAAFDAGMLTAIARRAELLSTNGAERRG